MLTEIPIRPLTLILVATFTLLTNGSVTAQSYTVDYTYDEQGRLTEATYGDSTAIDYTYDAAGNITAVDIAAINVGTEAQEGVPEAFAFHPAYPNPSRGATTLSFDVRERTHVRLAMFDVLGRQVAVLVDEDHTAGRYTTTFGGRSLPAGLYFYAIEMGDFRAVQKLVLVR